MAVNINKGTALSNLSLTPLIDIVFLLLIFFLVATRFAEEERELDIQLPDASEAQPLTTKPREMFINIDEQGRYFVTGKFLTLKELHPVLEAAYVNNPGRASVVIRADRKCDWEYVVAAMNACKKAKIRDYRVTTRESSA
ncbi:MAG: biopolymer transporter ExbD [Pirellulales bacterium]|nr:biopolymer transporter ExbD [Pirellulales bacterium]